MARFSIDVNVGDKVWDRASSMEVTVEGFLIMDGKVNDSIYHNTIAIYTSKGVRHTHELRKIPNNTEDVLIDQYSV